MIIIRKIFLVVFTIGLMVACSSSSDDGPSGKTDNFDRGALLTNLADNIIIPAFEDLKTKLSALDIARTSFVNDKNQSNLEALSDAWLEAYKTWQYVEMFNIGKAEERGGEEFGFVSFFNIHPLTVSDVQNASANGNYDLDSANFHDAQGFPALDFLIHGVADSDVEAIDKFTSNASKDGYAKYLLDVINQMSTLNNSILSDWKNNYRSTFVNGTSNSVTSSLNKIVNDFIFYYEKLLRAKKIGTPAGNFSNAPLPETVEAFYKKDVSKDLALIGLKAAQDFYNGKQYNGASTGESFKTYLEFLDRNDLAILINTRFDNARQKIQVLDNNFVNQINTDNTKMTEAYDALQLAVVNLKIDMIQAFGVVVDFTDADGD
ncbi:imelysin family protein [Algibacter sp. 2305UL17-15]|uniref:imelysin family protein n=1 Tax=Algibacter sp. 2305UL17-15 TaxID=3231268 RepID=UPI00345825C5